MAKTSHINTTWHLKAFFYFPLHTKIKRLYIFRSIIRKRISILTKLVYPLVELSRPGHATSVKKLMENDMLMCINNAQFMGSATNGHFCSIVDGETIMLQQPIAILRFWSFMPYFFKNNVDMST